MFLVLLASLSLGAPPEAFLCNPQSKPLGAGTLIVPALGVKQVAADVQPPVGTLLARPKGNGLFEVVVAPPRRAWVVDRNGNGRPDFSGDRWVFAGRGEGPADSIVEMSDPNGDGRAEQVAFCLAGEFWLGERAKLEADRLARTPARRPRSPFPLDRALDPRWAPDGPTCVWFDKNGDGTWCQGSILEGGEVSCDWLVLDREHEIWHGRMKEIRHYDLDGDGDIDIRAFAAAASIQRGANFDGSDQAPNPLQTYDLWSGTGFYRWPVVERELWREQFGTFDMRKNCNTSFAPLAAKYDLWMNMQDAPHGVYDLDGDGLRDAFLGASVSGGPADVFERPGQPPAVWHSLERMFVGLAGPGQLNFNLDVNPYKRPRGDRNLSLEIKTYRDRWGNELKNFVGAFSPPADWNGKALSPYNPDGSAAPWMWLWDWHLTKPYRDLYVATWVSDWKHAGEGAAIDIAMQDYRAEADFDCSTDFTLYWSPIAGTFHLRGVEWGWWVVAAPKPKEIAARWGDLPANFGLFASNQFSYGSEVLDTDLRRFYATRWACYFDRDDDGLIDAYLFDVDNDGLFDTRVWYDHARGQLLWAEGNRFRRASRRLAFPAESFALANYRKLRDFYREMRGQRAPLVVPGRPVELAGAIDSRPASTVGLDFYHADSAWHGTARQGYSRLLTSVSRRPVAVEPLRSPFSRQSLAGLTHLVVVDVSTEKGLREEELAALDGWLHAGGRLLVVLPDSDRQAGCRVLARRYGLDVGSAELVNLKPAPLDQFRGVGDSPLDYQIDRDGFCLDAVWPLRPAGEATLLLKHLRRVLAAETAVGKGCVLTCGSQSLLDNRYTAYKLPKASPFDRRRFSNRAFLENLVARWLP